jgi:hypothetical protein
MISRTILLSAMLGMGCSCAAAPTTARPSPPAVAATVTARPLPDTLKDDIAQQFAAAIKDAEDAIACDDLALATDALNRARTARNTDPSLFSQTELRDMEQKLASAQLKLQMASGPRNTAITNSCHMNWGAGFREARDRTIADLKRQTLYLLAHGRFRDARGVIEQIRVLDPTSTWPDTTKPLIGFITGACAASAVTKFLVYRRT